MVIHQILQALHRLVKEITESFFAIGISGIVICILSICFFINDSLRGRSTFIAAILFFVGLGTLIISVLFDAFYRKVPVEKGVAEDSFASLLVCQEIWR